MKKRGLICLLFCLAMGLSACHPSATTQRLTFEMKPSKETYTLDSAFLQGPSLDKPAGIAITDENIVIADSGQNCLLVYGKDGVYQKTIGGTGKGPGQFFSPTGLCYQAGLLYVADARNNRVQVLDAQFAYRQEYALTPIDSEVSYSDIAVDQNGIIYVASEYGLGPYAHIYRIDPEKKIVRQIGSNLVGSLAISQDNAVYFANALEIVQEKGSTLARSGENFLYRVKDGKAVQMTALPYKYAPMDFTCHDHQFFVLGLQYSTIDRYSLEGTYTETLFKFPQGDKAIQYNYFAYDPNEDYFLVSAPMASAVYCVRGGPAEPEPTLAQRSGL